MNFKGSGLIWCSAKYPVVTINHALNIFDDGLGIGYNIGCSFSATIAKSSIAQKAHNKNLCLVVPAFHGYAHRQLCQLFFHPLYVTGFGIEILRQQSASLCHSMDSPTPCAMHPGSTTFKPLTCMLDNTMMTNIRSYVHSNSCIQANIYIIIATFLLGNYKQVTQLLEELPGVITALQSGKSPEDMHYHQHLQTEQ